MSFPLTFPKLALFTLLSAGLPTVLVLAEDEAITPTEPIKLFNGKDLSNFYTWLADYQYEDPHDVFTVVDRINGRPAIRVSGRDWGGFITRDPYRNYHLIVEFRWGLVSWGRRQDRTRDSGILLHCQGGEGNASLEFNSPWMQSVEFQIIEGGTGDIILVNGFSKSGERIPTRLTVNVRKDRDGESVWDPPGEAKTFEGGRINWFGRDPDWVDELGFRGREDLEKPAGQWNRLDAFVKDDTFTYLVNGTIVNKGTDSSLKQGRILFQSEGAEIYFRRIELRPLGDGE